MLFGKKNMIDLLPYVSVCICVIFTGGGNWYDTIIPLMLLLPYIVKHRSRISDRGFVIMTALFLITGFIPVFVTLADKQNVMYEYEKILCFVFAFISGIAADDEDDIFGYITAAAVPIAVMGLLAYCGILRFEGWVFNDRYIMRLQSFTQYANTTALILGCGYFASMKFFYSLKNRGLAYLSALMLIALYLTVSKAAIPIFLIIGTLLLIKERNYTRYFITQNIICMLFAIIIILAANKHMHTAVFCLITVSVAVCGKIAAVEINVSEKVFALLWIIGITAFSAAAAIVFYTRGLNVFETLFKRFDYTGDALLLLKDHALIGIGPGAWKYYQYGVQTSQYNVAYIHNSWIQLWLDCGVIFFLTAVGAFIISTVTFIRKKQYVMCAVTLFIALHSVADINFSYGLVLMIAGFISGYALKKYGCIALSKPVFVTVTVICCAVIGYMSCEFAVRSTFENAYVRKDLDKAQKYALRLEKLCPYDSKLQISLAALKKTDEAAGLRRAEALSPLDPEIAEQAVKYSVSSKSPDILARCRHYIELAPMQEDVYAKADEYASGAAADGLCGQSEYDDFKIYLDRQRKKYKVTDRNGLLKQITTKE